MARRYFIRETSDGYTYNQLHMFDDCRNTMTVYFQDKKVGYVFGKYTKTVKEWDYLSVNDGIKRLGSRGILGKEVSEKEQFESERMGLLKLGAHRIKIHIDKDGIIKPKRFDDVCEWLKEYGMNYVDAQNQIIAMYEYEEVQE